MSGVEDAEARKAARACWPIRKYRLGEEPEEPMVPATTAEQRLLLVEEMTLASWIAAGRVMPTYTRTEAPGRVIRPARR